MRRVVETEVCVIGSGITAAMLVEKLADERDVDLLVVEAGDRPEPLAERARRRERYLAYGENPWPGDHIDGFSVVGRPHGFSPSHTLGGLAVHWGAVTPRFTPEDFRIRTLFGVGDDWPVEYADLEPAYQEAEERMGVAGDPGPTDLDPRAAPYPMPGIPLTWNLERLKEWGEASGVPFWGMPSAKNSRPYGGRAACCRHETCWPICPTGAKYSPEFTLESLERAGRLTLLPSTLVRRLRTEPGSERVASAEAVDRTAPEQPVEIRARVFVVAAGYVWSPHLLLLSSGARHPDGLANRSGLVGRYLAGHRGVNAFVDVPFEVYPGMNGQHSLLSTRYMRPAPGGRYLRHDFRIWESAVGKGPRMRDESGRVLFGDEILADWRERTGGRGTARLRGYYDVLASSESRLTLHATERNAFGDPVPSVSFVDAESSAGLRAHSEETIAERFRETVRAGGGTLLTVRPGDVQEHPGGGCRMGPDAGGGVVDSFGRAHEHENLFVVGAPTFVTAGCTNGTLTMAALGIRAAAALGREFPARADA